MKPAKHNYTILKQICQHIPAHLAPKLARSFGIDKKARSFSPWSHVVAMLHVQIARLCLNLKSGEIAVVSSGSRLNRDWNLVFEEQEGK